MAHHLFTSLLRSAFVVAACLGVAPAQSQTLSDGLDNPSTLSPLTTDGALLDGTDFPAGQWTYTTGTKHDGVDAVTSTLPNRTSSEINTTVQGPATVSFWWKMNGTASFDTLQFSSRNDLATITGNADWQQINVEVDMGEQPLNWFFRRLSNLPVGTEQAWLDELIVTPIPNNPALQTAVENFAYTIHSTDWTSSALAGALNSNAAKSGTIVPGDKSAMQLQITGPATVKFHWGMAAEDSDGSELQFLVNNSIASSLSTSQTLTETTFDLGPGSHTLKWEFSRGFNGSGEYAGATEAYVDRLIVSPYSESPTLAQAVERTAGVYSYSWTRQTAVSLDGVDAAMVDAPDLNFARRIYVDLPEEAGLFSFWYKMDADPSSGYLIGVLDDEQILQESGIKGWTKMEMNLGSGTDRVLQLLFIRYSNPNANSPNSKVYLDNVTFIPGATNFQPDLSIGPLDKGKRGAGIHNASGAGQISTIRAPLTRPVGEHVIRVQNGSATDTDTMTLRGAGNRRDFKIFYIVEESGKKLNFSAAFIAGIFETNQLASYGSEEHELWIVRKRKAVKKRSHVYQVIGTSKADPRKSDTVKTKLLIKNR